MAERGRPMKVDVQLVGVLILVGLAGAYLVRRLVKGWLGGGKAGCSGSCGCGAVVEQSERETERIPLEQIMRPASRN